MNEIADKNHARYVNIEIFSDFQRRKTRLNLFTFIVQYNSWNRIASITYLLCFLKDGDFFTETAAGSAADYHIAYLLEHRRRHL